MALKNINKFVSYNVNVTSCCIEGMLQDEHFVFIASRVQ
jgi:hypothetical protein